MNQAFADSHSNNFNEVLVNNESLRTLSSILVSCKLNASEENPQERLEELMQSPAVAAIIQASQILAKDQQMNEKDAMFQLINTVKELDKLWSQILISEGLAAQE